MKRPIDWLKCWILLTAVVASGCDVWIHPDEEGGDQDTAVVDVQSDVDEGEQTEQQVETKPAPKPVKVETSSVSMTTEIPEFSDGRVRVLLWRESDNARMPRWIVLLNGERWDTWVASRKSQVRIWDPQQTLNRRESAGWKKVRQVYSPPKDEKGLPRVPWLVVFKAGKCVANGPPQFGSTKPVDQVEDLIRFVESVGK